MRILFAAVLIGGFLWLLVSYLLSHWSFKARHKAPVEYGTYKGKVNDKD